MNYRGSRPSPNVRFGRWDAPSQSIAQMRESLTYWKGEINRWEELGDMEQIAAIRMAIKLRIQDLERLIKEAAENGETF